MCYGLPTLRFNRVGEEDSDYVHASTAYTADRGARRIGRENIKTGEIGGAVTETLDTSVEIARRTHACCMSIKRYLRELYEQLEVVASLKARMVKCRGNRGPPLWIITWTLRQEH